MLWVDDMVMRLKIFKLKIHKGKKKRENEKRKKDCNIYEDKSTTYQQGLVWPVLFRWAARDLGNRWSGG